MNGDFNGALDEESVGFLSNQKQSPEDNVGDIGPLLTREDLVKLDSENPSWRRARVTLLILFWVLWLGLLATAILIIVFTPRCPPRPKLEFWQSKVGYWVDPFAFKDSNNDMIGDFIGLENGINYIKNTVGAGFVILGSFLSGQYTNSANELGLIGNFTDVDAALGTMSDFRSMIKAYHKSGLEVVATLDFNAISISHSWTKEPALLKPAMPGKIARDGSNAIVPIGGKTYYSVGSKKKVDLNLQSSEVVQRLQDVVKFWLAEGVDGILLSDAAFFVEENGAKSTETLAKNSSSNNWFSNYPSTQLFTNGSVEFIRSIRQVIDEVSKSTTRKRLLAVDPGDHGYGLRDTQDDALKFFGTEDAPAAHLVISRQFTKDRGWKADPQTISWSKISINSYDLVSGGLKSSLGLATSTASDQRHSDLLALASTLLLPGTPIIHYGSELATMFKSSLQAPTLLFPKGKLPFPNLSERDSVLTCHLPMPWDRSGVDFSAGIKHGDFVKYLQSYGIQETVESALSIGREPTALDLVKQLTELRQKPSILWGKFEKFTPSFEVKNAEIFIREAEKFPAFIIALLSPSPDAGSVIDFSTICNRIAPRIVHPPKTYLSKNVDIESKAVYLSSENKPSVYVFECV